VAMNLCPSRQSFVGTCQPSDNYREHPAFETAKLIIFWFVKGIFEKLVRTLNDYLAMTGIFYS